MKDSKVWPFKWKLLSSTFLWCCLFRCLQKYTVAFKVCSVQLLSEISVTIQMKTIAKYLPVVFLIVIYGLTITFLRPADKIVWCDLSNSSYQEFITFVVFLNLKTSLFYSFVLINIKSLSKLGSVWLSICGVNFQSVTIQMPSLFLALLSYHMACVSIFYSLKFGGVLSVNVSLSHHDSLVFFREHWMRFKSLDLSVNKPFQKEGHFFQNTQLMHFTFLKT